MEVDVKITINEIAKRAVVSKATVSRVLNNSKPVSDEIRSRVLAVIEDTNFKPNAVARSLSLRKSHLIGIIIPDLSNPVFSRIISGIESQIRNLDYSLLITATDFDIDMKIQHIHILKDKGVDGLILVTDHGNEQFFQAMLDFEKPIVMIGSESYVKTIPVVRIDNYSAAKEATEYLLSLGHKQIGMVRGPLTDPQSGLERFFGYRDAMVAAGYYDESLVAEGWYSFVDGYRAMELLLSKKKAVTAVFCACDLMAIGAIRYATEQRINVPEEISVIGFDDVDVARMYAPSLTTIKQPFEESGELAIDELIEMIENKDRPIKNSHHILKHQLVVRESTIEIKK